MLGVKLLRISGRYLSNPLVWFAIISVALLCFFTGPYGTIYYMNEPIRLTFWSLKILILGIICTFFFALIEVQKTPGVYVVTAATTGFGAFAGIVTVLILLVLRQPIEEPKEIIGFLFYIWPLASGVFFTLYFLLSRLQPRPVASKAQPDPVASKAQPDPQPALHRRLQEITRSARILSLSAQDHYVEVHSDAGTELCLLRLKDAIEEMHPVDGCQVHRSHWVALSAIEKITREGRAYKVILTDNSTLPISAKKVKALKDRLMVYREGQKPAVALETPELQS